MCVRTSPWAQMVVAVDSRGFARPGRVPAEVVSDSPTSTPWWNRRSSASRMLAAIAGRRCSRVWVACLLPAHRGGLGADPRWGLVAAHRIRQGDQSADPLVGLGQQPAARSIIPWTKPTEGPCRSATPAARRHGERVVGIRVLQPRLLLRGIGTTHCGRTRLGDRDDGRHEHMPRGLGERRATARCASHHVESVDRRAQPAAAATHRPRS